MIKYEEWLTSFGSRLRHEREKQGLTRNALANQADTAQDYIAQLERGDKSPSMRTLINILTALDVSADSLIFGATEERLSEMDSLLNEFIGFLKRRSVEDATTLYEIMKFLSRYVIADICESGQRDTN
ncbi:MAG: helix-turn-helix domain-containing protein [Defluviitaleaceae bacterium]|nr:helix-turn-helix domain-containing protein [Defluviitaleaceae bacterium]